MLCICVFSFFLPSTDWIWPSSLFGWRWKDNVIAGFVAGIDCAQYRMKNANRMVTSCLYAVIAKVVVKSMG